MVKVLFHARKQEYVFAHFIFILDWQVNPKFLFSLVQYQTTLFILTLWIFQSLLMKIDKFFVNAQIGHIYFKNDSLVFELCKLQGARIWWRAPRTMKCLCKPQGTMDMPYSCPFNIPYDLSRDTRWQMAYLWEQVTIL